MDKDHLDNLHDRPSTRPPAPEQSGPSADLPSQVGNRAFTSLVQRASGSQGAGPLDPEIAEDIQAQKGGGRPLDDSTRADMEGHLGADLGDVRVHTGGNADKLNRSVQAEAFTTGSDVFFKSGKYAPDSTDGKRLLGHELAHVVQQRSGDVGGGGGSRVSHPDDAHEVEAKSVGDAVATAPSGAVARAEVEEEELQTSGGREGMEEEELQMSVDREGAEEEEELQMSVDREGAEEEEELQMSVDREEQG